MPVSVTELREQARLLEVELTRQATSSDSIDTKAGVAVGFAGVLVGLLVQVKQPHVALHVAVGIALTAAVFALGAAFPRRLRLPDPTLVADLYERLPEAEATSIVSQARARAIEQNYFIIESKRVLLALATAILLTAIAFSAIAVL
jgi:hypothetical protein